MQALAAAGLDTVEGAFAYRGGQELAKPSLARARRRTRIELTDRTGRRHVLYLKRYGPEGWIALARRCWLLYGAWIGPAGLEATNIARVRSMGIATMQVVRWGEEPGVLVAGRSYLIVTAVPGEALARCAEQFLRAGGEQATARLTEALAELVAKLHKAGYVHRDLYTSHIFMHQGPERD